MLTDSETSKLDTILTLGEASKEVGVTKTAISNAIKSGRLKAKKDGKGYFQIDREQLYSVYPPKNLLQESPEEIIQKDYSSLQVEVNLLREQLDREREINKRLFDQLDREAEERRNLMQLLTHQPQPEAKPAEDKPVSLLWLKLFGRRGNCKD